MELFAFSILGWRSHCCLEQALDNALDHACHGQLWHWARIKDMLGCQCTRKFHWGTSALEAVYSSSVVASEVVLTLVHGTGQVASILAR